MSLLSRGFVLLVGLAGTLAAAPPKPLLRPLSDLRPVPRSLPPLRPLPVLKPLAEPVLKPLADLRRPVVPQVGSILDTASCPASLRRGAPVITEGIQVRLDILRAMRVVSEAQRTLINFHDLVLTGSASIQGAPRTCVGVYDDSKQPNAVAIHSDTILFGHNLLRLLDKRQAKDELLTLVLLHEYAHLLQNHHRIDYKVGQGGQTLEIASTRRKEMVADCVAGTLFSQVKPGLLSWAENEAIGDVFPLLGDRHTLGDHGRACQRSAAFAYGNQRRNIADPDAPLAMTSGSILLGCQTYVDSPGVLFSSCK